MNRTWTARSGLAAIAVSLFSVLLPAVAQAAPEDTNTTAYRLPCGQSTCEGGSNRLSSDDVVSGSVQLQASTSSAVGLQAIELQLHVDGEWRCLERWTTSARSGRWPYNIDTSQPLESCNGSTITDASNGIYRFRTLASDRTGDSASASMVLRVSNRPAAPMWAGTPKRDASRNDAPVVNLQWYANSEPDIVEYHFTRSGPGGTREYAVSATHPGGQGCSFSGGIYTCTDDDFPSGAYAGDYSYSLLAYRSSPDPGTSCSLPGTGNCTYSLRSPEKSLKLSAPAPTPPRAPEPEPEATQAPRPRSSPTRVRTGPPSLSDIAAGDFSWDSGEFLRELPYGDTPAGPIPYTETPPSDDPDLAFDPTASSIPDDPSRKRALTALAGGLILLVMATHVMRVLKGAGRKAG